MLETVKIVSDKTDDNPNGYIIINKSDLDETMTLYKELAPLKADAGRKTTTTG